MRGGLGFPATVRCAQRVASCSLVLFAIVTSSFAASVTGAPESGLRGGTETVQEMLARDGVAPGHDPAASLAAEPLAPQITGTSFKAIGLSESGFIPPSPSGDVG